MKRLFILFVLISVGYANHRVRRVVDGRTASSGQFPYLVSLQYPVPIINEILHVCGGAIINEEYILTAAHCIYQKNTSVLSVLVGTNSLSLGGERYYIQNMRIHQDFETIFTLASILSKIKSPLNDIAVLQLTKNITFNDVTQPIPIASHSFQLPTGSKLTISGWGSINKYMAIYTDNIQYFEGKLISHKQCHRLYTYMNKKMLLTKNDICTMAPVDRGACKGDSGSPVICNGTLVGIVSRTAPVCGIGVPDIHTKVSRYQKWIDKSIAQMNKNPTGIIKKRKPASYYDF